MGKLPSVREYYKEYIDPNVDLAVAPKQPCPFHHEQIGRSLSYRPEMDVLTCFGSCHFYNADVIEVHRRWNRFTTREEAEASLRSMYHVSAGTSIFTEKDKEVYPDAEKVRYGIAYNNACRVAKTPTQWIELDYIMSQHPMDVNKLEAFYIQNK